MGDEGMLYYKRIALSIAAVAIIAHGARLWKDGIDSCKGLLESGWWRSNGIWQPYGCTLHRYRTSEAVKCLSNKRVAFVGDSRIRDLFHYFNSRLNGKDPINEGPKHQDLSFSDESNKIITDFFWAPIVDDSVQKLFESSAEAKSIPDIIIHASALWHIKTHGKHPNVVRNFQANLTKLNEKVYSGFLKHSVIVWFQQYPLAEFLVDANPSRSGRYSNDILAEYDKAAEEVFKLSEVKVVKSFREALKQRFHEDTLDGMHYIGKPMNLAVDLVLNIACNKKIEPADATCCVRDEIELTIIQILTGIFFLICAVAALFLKKKLSLISRLQDVENQDKDSSKKLLQDSHTLLWNLSKFGLILLYFYICDRTPIFMKESKVYGFGTFLACLGVIFLLGISSSKNAAKADYLNRDQTDEWKGWMQLVILAYHYLGASADLHVYVWIRILVASYLFMSAYGHFNYFWNKGDYSIFRFSQVMLRMNILTVLLCYVMNRPYQFYYFVPLVSFYFLVVYLVHLVWPQVDASKAKESKKAIIFMFVKIGLLFLFCFFLWKSLTFFNALFSWWPLVELFRVQNEVPAVREWWFRSGLDRFMAPCGMLFAFLLLIAKDSKRINTDPTLWPFGKILSWVAFILSLIVFLFYGLFSSTCPSKPECNATHSWISFLPITAFVLLRNIPPFLRSTYSTFFAWTGKISLELFIGQYHIWLANDTHSLLVFLPGYPVINAVITTFVFVCAAHEISSICGILTSYAVTKDTQGMLKRIAFMGGILAVTLLLHALTK